MNVRIMMEIETGWIALNRSDEEVNTPDGTREYGPVLRTPGQEATVEGGRVLHFLLCND